MPRRKSVTRTTEAATEKPVVRNEADRERAPRKRIGFGGFRSKLDVPNQIPGYHLHIFNDEGNRIAEAQAAGYTFVRPSEVGVQPKQGDDISDERVSWLVGTDDGGRPIRGYLMKIEQEYWEEDYRESQKPVDEVEAVLKGTQDHKADPKDQGGKFYGGAEIK